MVITWKKELIMTSLSGTQACRGAIKFREIR
jgi:hypothetical protein